LSGDWVTTAGNTTITEVGAFDDSSSGDMCIYGDFSVIT